MVKKNAFTIIELLVAMALLVILLGLSAMVFDTTVKAHRAAGATIEITRKLRAITDQLGADFRGLRKDAPLAIWFELDPANGQRYDQIQFFADGDFQTTKQYDTDLDTIPDTTICGNMARVYYGHAWQVDNSEPTSGFLKKGYRRLTTASLELDPSNILSRRAHVSTNIPTMVPFFPRADVMNNKLRSFPPSLNNLFEYDNAVSLALWKQLLTETDNCDYFLSTCLNNSYDTNPSTFNSIAGRPVVDMGDYQYLHTLLLQGVLQFQIQWAYTNEDLIDPGTGLIPLPGFTGVRWWPSEDPDSNSDLSDSDFDTMVGTQGGAYFNMPGGTTLTGWYSIGNCRTGAVPFKSTFYPKALKFTFVLRDRNGIFPDGKTFTYIVSIDN